LNSIDAKLSQMKHERKSRHELRAFGLTLAVAFAVLLGCLPPLLFSKAWHVWPFGLASTLALWSLAAPASLQVLYVFWMKLALALNTVTSPIILGLVFYLLVTPIGFLMRRLAGDPLNRAFDRDAKSYRIVPKKDGYKNMESPF